MAKSHLHFAAHSGVRNRTEGRVIVWKRCPFPGATWQKAGRAQLGPSSVCRPLHGAMWVSLTNDAAYFLPSLPDSPFTSKLPRTEGAPDRCPIAVCLYLPKSICIQINGESANLKFPRQCFSKRGPWLNIKKLPFLQNFPGIQIFRPDHKPIEPTNLGQESSNLCKNKPIDPH